MIQRLDSQSEADTGGGTKRSFSSGWNLLMVETPGRSGEDAFIQEGSQQQVKMSASRIQNYFLIFNPKQLKMDLELSPSEKAGTMWDINPTGSWLLLTVLEIKTKTSAEVTKIIFVNIKFIKSIKQKDNSQ